MEERKDIKSEKLVEILTRVVVQLEIDKAQLTEKAQQLIVENNQLRHHLKSYQDNSPIKQVK